MTCIIRATEPPEQICSLDRSTTTGPPLLNWSSAIEPVTMTNNCVLPNCRWGLAATDGSVRNERSIDRPCPHWQTVFPLTDLVTIDWPCPHWQTVSPLTDRVPIDRPCPNWQTMSQLIPRVPQRFSRNYPVNHDVGADTNQHNQWKSTKVWCDVWAQWISRPQILKKLSLISAPRLRGGLPKKMWIYYLRSGICPVAHP